MNSVLYQFTYMNSVLYQFTYMTLFFTNLIIPLSTITSVPKCIMF
jgi:hypothetical protein